MMTMRSIFVCFVFVAWVACPASREGAQACMVGTSTGYDWDDEDYWNRNRNRNLRKGTTADANVDPTHVDENATFFSDGAELDTFLTDGSPSAVANGTRIEATAMYCEFYLRTMCLITNTGGYRRYGVADTIWLTGCGGARRPCGRESYLLGLCLEGMYFRLKKGETFTYNSTCSKGLWQPRDGRKNITLQFTFKQPRYSKRTFYSASKSLTGMYSVPWSYKCTTPFAY